MNLDDFVIKFSEQLDETDSKIVVAETNFRDLEEWSSLTAMSIIAMVDEVYKVKLSGEEIRASNTIEDLFSFIKSK